MGWGTVAITQKQPGNSPVTKNTSRAWLSAVWEGEQ